MLAVKLLPNQRLLAIVTLFWTCRAFAQISQSMNVEWRISDGNGNNSFSKSKKIFGCLMKRGTF